MRTRCLYQVDWDDKNDVHHTDEGLTWPEASAEHFRLDHIHGNRAVRISSQNSAATTRRRPKNPGPAGAAIETAGRPGTHRKPPMSGTVARETRAAWLRATADRDEADLLALVALLATLRSAAS